MLGPKRRLVQSLCALLFLGLPLVRAGGDSLFRLDIPSRTVHLLGSTLRLVELKLLLVAVLLLLFAFLLTTMVLGRVWCGWLCPQSALSDLSEWLGRKLARRLPGRVARVAVREFCHAAIAFAIAAVFLCYFIPAGDFCRGLASGTLGAVAGYSFLFLGVVTYLNLALVRRTFCKEICPYGRLQFFTTDRGTLTLLFDEEKGQACLRCGACKAACPMEIDIREGTQVSCINCARCLDACRRVMAGREREGLIRYRFGCGTEESSGWGRRWLLTGVVLLLAGVLVAEVATRPQGTVKVQRGAGGAVQRLPGALVVFYTAYLENRGTGEAVYTLSLEPASGSHCHLLGPVQDLAVPANGDRRVDFAVQITPVPLQRQELQLHLSDRGKPVARALLPVPAGSVVEVR